MHMKRILVATDDAHTRAWIRHGISDLDATVLDSNISELAATLVSGRADLVVLDAGRSTEALVHAVEQAAAGTGDIALLVVIEPDALASLRLPVKVSRDFFVRGGTSEELSARARMLLWPGEEAVQQELIRIDELTLNLATYQAYLRGEPIDFTYLEYALFAFLVTHPGRTYSREVLLSRVWGSDYYGGSRTVDVHVRRIRAKIGHELSRRLETVRNVGYLWNA
jgi:DNA-binding response OmpR family regulator